MQAIVITRPGGPEVLELKETEQPAIGKGELLISVHAAGVNFPDLSQRKGNYPAPPGVSPDIPGLEVAGTVADIGPGVDRWKKGDKVCALLAGGGYAEYCAVAAGQCLPIPAGLSFEQAAALPETIFTVWSNVFIRGNLRSRESLLVHGGSGGIGVMAIQLAKAAGATVIATAGTDEKCEACIGLGADRAINYKTESFKDVVKEITGGRGVDVILDMIGGDYMNDNISSLAEDGRLLMINFMRGEQATLRLGPILRKRLTITGSTLRPRDAAFKSALAREIEIHVWPWIAAGKVKPVIYRAFPLAQASEAHRLMERGEHIGKLVLTCA